MKAGTEQSLVEWAPEAQAANECYQKLWWRQVAPPEPPPLQGGRYRSYVKEVDDPHLKEQTRPTRRKNRNVRAKSLLRRNKRTVHRLCMCTLCQMSTLHTKKRSGSR